MKNLLKKVWSLIKPYWKGEIIGIVFTCFYSVSVFLSPIVSKYLLDQVIPTKSYFLLMKGLLVFCLVCLLQPIFGYIKDKVFLYVTEDITYDLRSNLFNKIIHATMEFFDKKKGGELTAIVLNDGRGASDFISKIYAILLKNILMVLMILIGMFTLSFGITIVVITLFLLFFVINNLMGKKFRIYSKENQENYDRICTCIDQSQSAILTIKSYTKEASVENRFQTIIKKIRHDNIRLNSLSILIDNLTSAIVILCLGIIYGWGSILIMRGESTIGSVVAMGLYFQLLQQPFYELVNIGINANVTVPIFERINNYLEVRQESYGAVTGDFLFDSINIRNLSFSYINNKSALKNVTMQLPNKGLVLVTGESGSGKSTFIKTLMGMYRVERKHIFFDDKDINDISLSTLRKNIGYVSQDCEIMNDSFLNNLNYGNENILPSEIVEICKKVKLHDRISALPDGYNSIINERVNLSGGEKQRISIARVIIKNSPVIILDEPLSSLDEQNIMIINDIIMQLSREKLVIMVTHQVFETLIPTVTIIFNDGIASVNCHTILVNRQNA